MRTKLAIAAVALHEHSFSSFCISGMGRPQPLLLGAADWRA